MKHLRKALSNHRLIRSQPDSPAAAHSDSATTAHDELPLTWQRRKPSFDTLDAPLPPQVITLWDEIDKTYEKKV
ncbi:MAG: hypothetical protein GYB41_08355 [Oceanospirillales bacterium]|uniref:Uncharacterized protein n=1 Tax=Marinobacterium halophilum TaxID=267374 RepID=A0A2P8F318_9GAMM|nr:hypothetical protein [Marinobacterium halophilum]MBR9828638.1 hypothetical protein [Oceanospirillales bacterium]PSL16108.1 hypothetical protein CLV44_10231 [Marinobacterium halophilum]